MPTFFPSKYLIFEASCQISCYLQFPFNFFPLNPNLVTHNLIPCISQDPNKTQMVYSILSSSGKFSYKGVGRVVATTRLVSKLANQILCLNIIQADSNPKSGRSLVLPGVLLDQMSPTPLLTQVLLFLLEGFQFILFRKVSLLTNQHFLSLHFELHYIVMKS